MVEFFCFIKTKGGKYELSLLFEFILCRFFHYFNESIAAGDQLIVDSVSAAIIVYMWRKTDGRFGSASFWSDLSQRTSLVYCIVHWQERELTVS